MSKPVVLRLGNVKYAQEAWEKLGQIAQVITVDESSTRADFLKQCQDSSSDVFRTQVIARTFASVQNTGRFDEELAKALPKSVAAVCHNGAGYDQIDVGQFASKHIQVSNVPELVNNATADTHVYLLLGALRNFEYGHRLMLENKWPNAGAAAGAPVGNDPEGKTVGILGLGGIGRAIVERLKPFGFKKFIYHNRNRLSSELENGCQYVSFEELLRVSDVVSINIPLNPKTRHIIDSKAIDQMKDGVVIVNTARGAVIDEKSLIAALKSGKVRSAGLDVYENEPNVPQELLDLPNVCGVPHMGTHTVETIKKMEEFVVENVESVIKSGKVLTIVPEMKSDSWVNEQKPLK
ncbi:LANO_0G02036g1_1 [Lachancea nothofagi CBS 11611]|uniref:LANO_0G02036g1_1 n=1 Tax=Lachancea nothofagi CBS 11611 TaxID=1266666 RepID=A0A1G4KF33_9SACH|nr:LANO_0G02036g1_1 [Lachancea nothofagi CBS 11611]